ncbi:MAG: hypothetical protein HY720_00800 [Planctomycetes bacterium]|nr:hypothetical protein [Planctomycetota bacterium]
MLKKRPLPGWLAGLIDHGFFVYNDLFFRDREVRGSPRLREDRFDGDGIPVRRLDHFFSRVREPAPLAVVPGSERTRNGCRIHDFTYASPILTGDAHNDVVRGRRYERRSDPTAPAVVLVLPYRQIAYFPFDLFAARLARAGFQAAILQTPYHLNRRSRRGTPGDGIATADLRSSFKAIRQGVKDLSALVERFRADGATSVGVFGMSLGSLISGHLAASDPDLAFAVLTAPAFCPGTILLRSNIFRRLRGNFRRLGLTIPQAAALLSAVHLDRRRPRVQPERILIVKAEHDRIVPPEEVERLWELWGRPPIRRLSQGHISVLFDPTFLPAVFEHLDRVGARPR